MSVKQSKRFVPVAEYQRRTGHSYQTVMHLIRTRQVSAIQTEGGHYKIDTQETSSMEAAAIVKKLEEHERMLKALCGHLGVK